MAFEAVLVYRLSNPINFICTNSVGIEKGAILKISGSMTAYLTAGTSDVVAGVCAMEKIANDGITEVAVYRDGIFRCYISGNASIGDMVGTLSGNANYLSVLSYGSAISGSKIFGTMLESATTGQQKLVELRPAYVLRV